MHLLWGDVSTDQSVESTRQTENVYEDSVFVSSRAWNRALERGGGGFPVHKFCLSCLGTAIFPQAQGVLNQLSAAVVGLGCERALEREAWGC